MPFKSEAQRRKFAKLVKEGKMSKVTFDKWNKETPEKIPERVSPKRVTKVRQPRRVARTMKIRGNKE